VFAQSPDPWYPFWNKDSTLIGFKDKNGIVKIEPKFSGLSDGGSFENIIAITEEINGTWNNYYLTKTGKIVGRDSLYIFDNTTDCELEGFIRFHDRKTDKMGMFNKKGDIGIPATYNYLSRVRNGMIEALTGAKKKIMGEHFWWEGGRQSLIDTNNNILIDNFNYDGNLNFYSLLIADEPNKDTTRQNFKGANGQYYSFIDFEKEFRSWLQSNLLAHFTKAGLLNCSQKKITFWKEPGGWIHEAKSSFINRNFELIKTKLLALNSKACDFTIFVDDLIIYDESDDFKRYFNNCGESRAWIYPVMSIVINYKDKKGTQDHFDFLRTGDGYKLISITIRKGRLR
jgi:hypothetical protein